MLTTSSSSSSSSSSSTTATTATTTTTTTSVININNILSIFTFYNYQYYTITKIRDADHSGPPEMALRSRDAIFFSGNSSPKETILDGS